MLIPYLVILGFSLILLILDIFKPQAARIILGIFFLVMALGVNLPLALTNPSIYVTAGSDALLPIYKWFFTAVIAWKPLLFVFPLILFEITVGILILSKGLWTRLGLSAGAFFSFAITPIGMMTLTNPAISLAMLLLLRTDFEKSVPEMVISSFKHHRSQKRIENAA
jgi:hypothetical protein